MNFVLQLSPRLYEQIGSDANLLRNGQQIGFVRFEKANERGEQRRVARLALQLVCPDSGQVEEPLRPTLLPERCRKRGKGKSNRVIWCPGVHSLETAVGR